MKTDTFSHMTQKLYCIPTHVRTFSRLFKRDGFWSRVDVWGVWSSSQEKMGVHFIAAACAPIDGQDNENKSSFQGFKEGDRHQVIKS